MYNITPLEDRFWSKVNTRGDDECWPWMGHLNNKGYGMIRLGSANRGKVLAHRLSYELAKGKIPEGSVIMHMCDNPACVNPAHLSVGTQKQNMLDKVAKGRDRNGSRRGSQIGTSVLTDEQVASIRERYIAGIKMNDILSEFGVSRPTVKRIISGKTWAHLFGVMGPDLEQLKACKRGSGWLPVDEAKLDISKARELKKLLSSGMSSNDVAAMFGLSRRYVDDIRKGINWKNV